jgi:hypothetical protein
LDPNSISRDDALNICYYLAEYRADSTEQVTSGTIENMEAGYKKSCLLMYNQGRSSVELIEYGKGIYENK